MTYIYIVLICSSIDRFVLISFVLYFILFSIVSPLQKRLFLPVFVCLMVVFEWDYAKALLTLGSDPDKNTNPGFFSTLLDAIGLGFTELKGNVWS